MQVRVANSKRIFEVADGQSVLDAALAAAWNLPHGCKGGNCGLCKARLLRGEVHYAGGRPLGLGDAEVRSGYILTCQARPRTDLELELHEILAAHERGANRLPCRIEAATRAAHDVMIVQLRMPPAVDFAFRAGQYVDILLPGGRRRSFSIASAPHEVHLLELHVRKVPGGALTQWLFGAGGQHPPAPPDAAALQGSLVTVEGPLGGFWYREPPSAAKPLLLVGGGTGVAPLLSMLRHLSERRIARDTILYWGVRDAGDLYAEPSILNLLAGAPHLRYVPVLSQPAADWAGRTGFVHAAVLADVPDLRAYDIYAAGPPAMIEALQREFPRHGASAENLYCDAFDYARDPPERQRPSSATKS